MAFAGHHHRRSAPCRKAAFTVEVLTQRNRCPPERLAAFKAEVPNDFVRARGIDSVIEFGCGDGAQLALAEYPAYVGIDVSPAMW